MLRAVVFLVLVVLAMLVAFTIWLVIPLWSEPPTVTLSESAAMRGLLEQAPPGAKTIIAIPSFAPAVRRYEEVLAPLLGSEDHRDALLASAWLLGGAPVGAWSSGDSWGAIAKPGAVRALLIRAVGPWVGLDVRVDGDAILLGRGSAAPQMRDLPAPLVNGLRGEIFLRHIEADGYPPTPVPALTALGFAGGRLTVETRAEAEETMAVIPLEGLTLPTEALLAVRFAEPPEGVLAIEKAVPLDLPRYLADGGMVALYGVETGGLVPRPRLVFAIPADEARAAEISARLDSLTTRGAVGLLLGMGRKEQRLVAGVPVTRRRGIGMTVEMARRGGELLLAFDDSSLERYLSDQMVPAGEGEAVWALRASPDRLLPLLDELAKDEALRLFASDFSRETRTFAAALRRLPPTRELRSQLVLTGGELLLRSEARLAK